MARHIWDTEIRRWHECNMTTISTGNTWLVFKVHEATPFSSSLTWVSAPSPKGRKLLFLFPIQSNPIQLLIKNIDKNRHHGNLVLCAYVDFVFWIKKKALKFGISLDDTKFKCTHTYTHIYGKIIYVYPYMISDILWYGAIKTWSGNPSDQWKS